MAHIVTCVYCKNTFDRDKVPFQAVSERRYAHLDCFNKRQNEIEKEEQDYRDLEEYIMKLFSKEYLTAKVRKQIKDYKQEYNYTFSGMLKTLKWWYEIKGNTIDKANQGIGIIPFIYDQALKYYYAVFLAEESNKNINFKYVVREVEIAPPQAYVRPPKLFNMEEAHEQ